MSKADVLVAVPVYNEAKYVRGVLERLCGYAEYILVIDDGSRDGSGEIVNKFECIDKIAHSENMGYGQSLMDAFGYAADKGFEWVVTIDCDLQHEPERLGDFYKAIERDDFDIISGSRYLQCSEDDRRKVPYDRYVINKLMTRYLNKKLGLELTDSFCGFKAYRVEGLKKLRLSERGYGFPMQFWVQASLAGLRICEIGVDLIYVDAKRCFGEGLDKGGDRFRHYMDIIRRELCEEGVWR